MKRLTYRSHGTDDINIVCSSVDEAINWQEQRAAVAAASE